jgi:hypothetical protein
MFLERGANRSSQSLERDTEGAHKIVLRHRIWRYRDLVASANDQVDWTSWCIVADLKAPENEARREQHLAKILVLPVRPELIVDLKFRPKILEQMILERGVPKYRITEVPDIRLGCGTAWYIERVDCHLHTDGAALLLAWATFARRAQTV